MNVIFISIDSLNRHYLPTYGQPIEYPVQVPNLDRFARRALTFERHYAGSLPCMPARREFFYFSGAMLGAVRLDEMKFQFLQQPTGWPGPKIATDMPSLTNLRQDPFERYPMISGESALTGAFGYGNDFFAREFWRFVEVQQKVAQLAMTAIDYPPMQDPASFNLEAVKKKIEAMIKEREGK